MLLKDIFEFCFANESRCKFIVKDENKTYRSFKEKDALSLVKLKERQVKAVKNGVFRLYIYI